VSAIRNFWQGVPGACSASGFFISGFPLLGDFGLSDLRKFGRGFFDFADFGPASCDRFPRGFGAFRRAHIFRPRFSAAPSQLYCR
jgi:hypothetical protein